MRNVIITGAAGGLGLTTALAFAEGGDHVITCDISDAALSEKEKKAGIERHRVDVSDAAALEAFFDAALAGLTTIDVLVNNVGVAGPHGPVETVSLADWHAVLNANLISAAIGCAKVLPLMKKAGKGSIVNISTSSVKNALPQRAPYVVSKAAVESLTSVIAREAGPFGINCNTVRPGMMDNERLNRVLQRVANESGRTLEDVVEEHLQFISMRSKVSMNEVAAAVLFLASDQAKHITGQTLAVDGGTEWEG